MRRWMMGATVMLGLALPTTGRAQTLGDTAAAMGTHSTLSGTSAGNPAATLGTVKSHVAAASSEIVPTRFGRATSALAA